MVGLGGDFELPSLALELRKCDPQHERSTQVCSREDGLERTTETICFAHVLPCYHSHMILSKEALNGMTVPSANGDTVVQIHVWQMQSGVLEWGCHTP
jgi:hypothetical protein